MLYHRVFPVSLLALVASSLLPIAPISAVAYPTDTVSSTRAPWVAAIYFGTSGTGASGFSRICTGSLIDPRHILTAAHCVAGEYPSDITVGLGGQNQNEAMLYQVSDFEVHPRYTQPMADREVGLPHDVAVLRLSEPIVGIEPVRLAPKKDMTMRRAKNGMALYGWGVDQNGYFSEYIGYTKQTDFSTKAKRWFPNFNSKTQIAAGLQRNREKLFSGACYGDSGGPLVGFDKKRKPYVLGVVSYGVEDCKAAAPSVYGRVASYRSWITTARNKMLERAPRTPLEYAVADELADGVGASGWAADISGAYLAVSPSAFTLKISLPDTLIAQGSTITFNDHDRTPDTPPFAVVTADGVYNSYGQLVCPASWTEGSDDSGYYALMQTSTTCLQQTFGRTSFDVDILVYAGGADQAGYSGFDSLYIDYVSLPLA